MRKANTSASRGADGRRWLVGLLLLGLLQGPVRVAAAPPPAVRAQLLPPDRSTQLAPRPADAGRLRELAAQREFRYVEPEESSSFWEALWARLWRWLRQVLGRTLGTSTGQVSLKYVVYAVLALILAFAVLKLLQVELSGLFGRAPRRSPLPYDTADENIHDVDFRTRIAEAEAAGNLRLATRLGYLEVLKQLSDQGLISWQPDKTNHTYLAELAAGPLRNAFREATRQFEYVWYGELRLTPTLYQQVREGHYALATQLGSPGAGRWAPAATSTAA
jgi:hypothetical protein